MILYDGMNYRLCYIHVQSKIYIPIFKHSTTNRSGLFQSCPSIQ